MDIEIVVNLQVEGFHRWEKALKEVEFLSHDHRHIFHITCWKKVPHDDRAVEIITFKREIKDYLEEQYPPYTEGMRYEEGYCPFCYFDTLSCEGIAKDLLNHFKLSMCQVMEDGENGVICKI